MKTASIEFVTFDAGDVITTSTKLGYFSATLRDSGDKPLTDQRFFYLGSDAGTYYFIDPKSIPVPSGFDWFVIQSAEYYDDDGINYVLDVDGTKVQPTGSGYKNLEDYEALRTWLQGMATPMP